jgi:formylglycine-generating enzyme required for sulfatase activity
MRINRIHKWPGLVAGFFLGAVLLPACTREYVMDSRGELPPGERVEVAFTASTGGAETLENPETRTSDGGRFWETGDEVGIFMYASGEALSDAAVSNGAANRKYLPQKATASAALSPATADQAIYFPGEGTVDFVAYYPWKATGTGAGEINNYVYPVDLSNQSDPAALDLLYARKTDMGGSITTVNLVFAHPLSKISLHVRKGADIGSVDFSAATATLEGMPATAGFNLASGAIVSPGVAANFAAKKVETTATFDAGFEALILPQSGVAGRKVTFAAGGNTYEWLIPATAVFAAGKNHIYTLTISAEGAEEEGVLVASIGSLSPWADIIHSAASGIERVRIPKGTFAMGSPNTEPGRGSWLNYETQHSVTLTKDFYMSKYEITNAQYAAFLNARVIVGEYDGGSARVGKYGGNVLIHEHEWGVYWDTENSRWKHHALFGDHPVVSVTWYGADEFARWAGGSLPTEAQWEYACRAGTTTPFGVGGGDSLYADRANFNGVYPYALPGGHMEYYLGNEHPKTYLGQTAVVGSYPPNAWGLYDMHGNAAEWCSDRFDSYSSSSATDPVGPATGNRRVMRGGGYSGNASECRSAFRGSASGSSYHSYDDTTSASYSYEYSRSFFGFRVVFEYSE